MSADNTKASYDYKLLEGCGKNLDGWYRCGVQEMGETLQFCAGCQARRDSILKDGVGADARFNYWLYQHCTNHRGNRSERALGEMLKAIRKWASKQAPTTETIAERAAQLIADAKACGTIVKITLMPESMGDASASPQPHAPFAYGASLIRAGVIDAHEDAMSVLDAHRADRLERRLSDVPVEVDRRTATDRRKLQ